MHGTDICATKLHSSLFCAGQDLAAKLLVRTTWLWLHISILLMLHCRSAATANRLDQESLTQRLNSQKYQQKSVVRQA
jgi:hypothetical protein